MITFLRVLFTGLRNLFRNSWLTIAAVAVMVVAITIVLSSFVLNKTAQNAITELSKSLQVSVYLLPDISDQDREVVKTALEANVFVDEVRYIDTQEAERRFNENFGGDEGVVDGLNLVGAGALPQSLEVSVNDLEKFEEVGAIASPEIFPETVESVSLGRAEAKKTIEKAASAKKFALNASLITALIFGAVSVLIIFNTIRMAIFTRSEEIAIMKLIGATPAYIRGPFLIEASMYGLIAGIIAHSAIYTFILSVGPSLSRQVEFSKTFTYFTGSEAGTTPGFLSLFSHDIFWSMLAVACLGGVLVGVLSSLLAMKRYLKLQDW